MTTPEQDSTVGRLMREDGDAQHSISILHTSFGQVADDLEKIVWQLRRSPETIQSIAFDSESLETKAQEYRELLAKRQRYDGQLCELGIRKKPIVINVTDRERT